MNLHLSRRARAALSLTVASALTTSALGATSATAAPTGEPVINEFSASTTGTDVEYVELLGPPGWDASAYRVLEIEGDAGGGTVDSVITVPAPDATGGALVNLPANELENGTLTLLLVKGFTGSAGADLDTDDDGTLDVTPWTAVVDDVAVHDGGTGDRTYSTVTLGVAYDGLPYAPGGASRIPDGTDTDAVGDWTRNDFDLAGIPGLAGTLVDGEAANTPGTVNSLTVDDGDGDGGETGDPTDCDTPDVPIGAVQGSGSTSPRAGQDVTVQGTVVGDYEGPSPALRGFYLQDAGDGDPATSDGIFVFQGNDDEVALGDVVQVTGRVAEYQGQTQVDGGSTIALCGTDGSVSPTEVTLPLASENALERYEGMLVTFPQRLTVTEHFQLGRFGQVVVSSGGRLQQPTSIASPGPEANAVQATNDLNRLIVDDDLQMQNPDPIKLGRDGQPLTPSNTLRGGDTATGLTGVLTYTWGGNSASPNAYRLRPFRALDGSAYFEAGNARPTTSPDVGGTLRVSAFNVLNYFATLDYPKGDPRDNACGPDNDMECRGADSPAELERQQTKLVTALRELDADVLGLVEIENSTGVDPLEDPEHGLVTELNDATAPGTYAAVDTGVIGTDAIRVGLVYQPSAVEPVGDYEVIDSGDDPRFRDDYNRPVLVQTFQEVATGERFTVAVNHLKSKGSACDAVGDPDRGDGQGRCNETRRLAAEATGDVLDEMVAAGEIDEDLLVLGDLNAYAQEDPVQEFVDAGFVDLVQRFGGPDAYSYVFDGQWGYLDHALASSTMVDQVTGAAEWHVNADEPSVLDYNTDFKSTDQIETLYAPDEFRTSDHDPVVVGLALDGPPWVDLVGDAGSCLDDSSMSLQVRVGAGNTDVPGELTVTAAGSGRAVDAGSVAVSGVGDVRTVRFDLADRKKAADGLLTVVVSDGEHETTLDIGVRSGGNGDDDLTAEDGMPWVLVGGNGDDRLTGAERADLLCGGNGDDVLVGRGGEDTLVGGRGDDSLEQ